MQECTCTTLQKLFKCNIKVEYKIRVFKCILGATLPFKLKEIVVNNPELRRLNIFALRKLKSILGYKFDDKVSYENIKAEINNIGIKHHWPSEMIKKARISMCGHNIRHDNIPKAL